MLAFMLTELLALRKNHVETVTIPARASGAGCPATSATQASRYCADIAHQALGRYAGENFNQLHGSTAYSPSAGHNCRTRS
jgi:hypothetical protein